MEIREERKEDFLIVSLAGRLDANNAKIFEEKVFHIIDRGEARFVIDLSRVDYVSSAGLRAFLVASKRLSAVRGRIVLCSLQESVREVFDIVGFYSIFSVCKSRDEALTLLR